MRSQIRFTPARSPLPSRQRGAIGLLSAAVLLLAVLAIALALDTGRLMLEKRRLQQQADLAALAAAQRYCNGFASAVDARDEVLQSLDDNGFVMASPADVEVALGETPSMARLRTFVEGGDGQAARVRLRRSVPASLFAGGLAGGDVTLQAEATARRDLIGALSVGTRLVNLDSDQSQLLQPLLGGLLGAAIDLDAASYAGLANARIPLRLLSDELVAAGVIADIGTLEELLNAELGFGQFLGIMAQALEANGDAADVIMQALQGQVAAGVRATTTLRLADILVAETGHPDSGQALGAAVNALDLLMASAMAINRDNLLTIPNLGISTAANPLLNGLLGNTLTTTLRLRVIEPPAIAVGRFGFDENGEPRTRARSAQVEAALGINLDISPSGGGLTGGLLDLVARVRGNIGIGITVAGGEGWLGNVDQCPTLMSRDFRFTAGARTEAATLRIGDPNDLAADATLQIDLLKSALLLPVVSIDPLEIRVGQTLSIAGSNQQGFIFDVDLAQPAALPTPSRTVGTDLSDALSGGFTGNGIRLSPEIRVRLLILWVTLPLGDIINPLNLLGGLTGVLNPLLSALAQTLLEPLLELLGISVGEVDVRLLDVEEGHGALLI